MSIAQGGAVLVGFGAFVFLVFILLLMLRFMGFIRQVPPNQALIVTGVGCRTSLAIERRRRRSDGTIVVEPEQVVLNYRVVRGGMTFVFPMIQRAEVLDLRVYEREVLVANVLSNNAVPISVDGVAQLAIGEDDTSIATAARLQLEKSIEDALDSAKETLQGHLRAIIGLMTVEDVYKNREVFAQRVNEVAYDDLAGLGFQIVSLVIREINDEVGYLKALGEPEIAAVLRDARIAKAEAERAATLEEQDAEKKKAEYAMTTNVAKAEYSARVSRQEAVAQRANQISLAEQDQRLEEQRAQAAEIAARRRNMELEAEIRRPADAERYAVEQSAQAALFKAQQEAEARKASGFAQAEVTERTGEAEAEAAKVRGLAGADVVRATRLAEAEGSRATLLAEAAGVEAKLLAEAKGRRELADSLNAYDENALRQVLGLALLEGVPAVAQSFGAALANIEQVRLIDLGSGGEGEGTTLDRYMDVLPRSLFKFLQGAAGLLGTPIDDLVMATVVEAAKKRGVKISPEQEESLRAKAAVVAAEMEQLTEEPSAPEATEPLEQARETPEAKPRRRRLIKE